MDIIKCLSIKQPWAWLIVNGHKDIENRDWYTKYRGFFFVHASKKIDNDGIEIVETRFPHIKLPDSYETGGIVGIAELVGCLEKSSSKWFVGDYGFLLRNQKKIPFIQTKGQLGFFTPSVELPKIVA